MNQTTRILLRWLVKVPTGQSPRGQSFSRPARFDNQGDDWTQSAWSLVINPTGAPDAKGQQSATARFLVADAPHDWLSVGRRFTLYEGTLALAECVVQEGTAE
jgi:hypothetical protein